jgi:hypothetical protein
MSDSRSAEMLQLRMARIRRRMDADVEGLLSEAQQLLDWTYYIKRHPIACVVAAASLGFFAVPKLRPPVEKKVYLDPEVSREIAGQAGPVHVEQPVEETAKKGLLFSLGALALNTALRAGMTYAKQHFRTVWKREFQGREQTWPGG